MGTEGRPGTGGPEKRAREPGPGLDDGGWPQEVKQRGLSPRGMAGEPGCPVVDAEEEAFGAKLGVPA